MSEIRQGVVTFYDTNTQTVTITDIYTGNSYDSGAIPMKRYDLANGAFSCTPPCINATCLYTVVNGDCYLLAMYGGVNISEATASVDNPYNALYNRSANTESGTSGSTASSVPTASSIADTTGQGSGSEVMATVNQGTSTDTTSMGGEYVKTDALCKIKLNPLFYSCWNLLNMVWDNMCNIFKFVSSGVDVTVNVDDKYNTDTTILVRKVASEKNGVPSVDLKIGKTANLIKLKINGEDTLEIDNSRNIKLLSKDITVKSANVNVEASNITVKANSVDMTACGKVMLP